MSKAFKDNVGVEAVIKPENEQEAWQAAVSYTPLSVCCRTRSCLASDHIGKS
jgi:hypothetical protein